MIVCRAECKFKRRVSIVLVLWQPLDSFMGWSGQTFPIKGVNEMDFLCFASSGTISVWNASFGTFISNIS